MAVSVPTGSKTTLAAAEAAYVLRRTAAMLAGTSIPPYEGADHALHSLCRKSNTYDHVQRVYVALGAVAFEIAHPPGQVAPAVVLLDQLGDLVDALPRASRALDAQHVELPLDVAEH